MNARPDHKKRCIRRSAGLNPAFKPCRVATKPSAQNSAAPRPQATPSKTGVTPNFFDRVSAPLVGSVIAERLRQLTLRFNPRACRADERHGRRGERPALSQSFQAQRGPSARRFSSGPPPPIAARPKAALLFLLRGCPTRRRQRQLADRRRVRTDWPISRTANSKN